MCPVQATTPWATFPPGPDRSGGGGGSSSGWKEERDRASPGRAHGRPTPLPVAPGSAARSRSLPSTHPARSPGAAAAEEAAPRRKRSPRVKGHRARPPGLPRRRAAPPAPTRGARGRGNRGARSAVEPSRSRLTPAAAGLERADARTGGTRGRDRGERGTGERDGRGELSGFGKTWGWGGGVGRSEFVTPPRARRGAGLSAPARWRGGAAAGRGDVPWVKPRGPPAARRPGWKSIAPCRCGGAPRPPPPPPVRLSGPTSWELELQHRV